MEAFAYNVFLDERNLFNRHFNAKVTPGDPAQAPEAQRQGFAEQMAQMAGNEDVEGLVKALRSRARIEVAEDRL